MTIVGNGFDSSTTSVSSLGLESLSITYNQITFVTRPRYDDIIQIEVTINGVTARCDDANGCSFEFSSQDAPTVSSASPTNVSAAATLTLTGNNFGTDPTKLSVLIGKTTCQVTQATTTSLTCTVTGLEAGAQNVYLSRTGKFYFLLYIFLLSISLLNFRFRKCFE